MKKRALAIGITLIVFVLFILSYGWDRAWTAVEHTYYQLGQDSGVTYASTIETVTFPSQALGGRQRELKIYLPSDYNPTGSYRYPVLYLLHGYPGSDTDWLINTNLQKVLDSMVASHTLPPLLVIFPDGNGPLVRDGQYINGTTVKQNMEQYLLEVVHFVDSHYHTNPDRHYRALGGISSGAYAAVNVGLHYTNLFAFMISHSGYFLDQEPAFFRLLNHDPVAQKKNNPLAYIATVAINPKTFIYMDVGGADFHWRVAQNQQMDQALTKRHIPHEFHITAGWHNWNVWRNNIQKSLPKLGQFWQHKQA
ncbi:MAG: alpha/beta hydrolase-fold protein [Chloroflexi bacterium]|nr:alpha/beta hydrolase-fold protein [Chloroflexota bacterium]